MEGKTPEISIVTPSFNMLPYLKLCSASVFDQDIAVEHIVMDGGSTDGIVEWLKHNTDVTGISERDNGMYHALNKAIDKSKADIVGRLNCDEQYLPGVLKFVKQIFDENPSVDFIAGSFLIVNPEGELLAYRKSFQPRWPYFFSNYLYTTTCALFYRRKVFSTCRFDESYRSIADVIFLYNVIKKGYKGIHLKKYFSVFTYSGVNLSLNPISKIEKERFNNALPRWFKVMKPVFFLMFFVEKILHGAYGERAPLHYSIFTKNDLSKRAHKAVNDPGFRLKFIALTNNEH